LRIQDFRLLRTIGTGTFGKVYLAIKDDKPLAIKVLKKSVVI
jgi:serine/threonine protein kinase